MPGREILQLGKDRVAELFIEFRCLKAKSIQIHISAAAPCGLALDSRH